jgi:hypothetical protein
MGPSRTGAVASLRIVWRGAGAQLPPQDAWWEDLVLEDGKQLGVGLASAEREAIDSWPILLDFVAIFEAVSRKKFVIPS